MAQSKNTVQSINVLASRLGSTNYKPITDKNGEIIAQQPIEKQRKGFSIEFGTPQSLEAAEAFGLTIYTPKATEENPNPAPFARASAAQIVQIFDNVGGKVSKEALTDAMPNFEFKNVNINITKSEKAGNEFFRVSAILVNEDSEYKVMAYNPFGLDMQKFDTVQDSLLLDNSAE